MTYCLAIRLDEGLVFLADPPYDGGVLPNNGSASCASSGSKRTR